MFEVYKMYADGTNKVYYGSSENGMDWRHEDHMAALRYGRHFNNELQYLYDSGIRDWKMQHISWARDKKEARGMEKNLVRSDVNSLNIIFQPGKRASCEPKITDQIIEDVFQYKVAGFKQYVIAKMVGISGCTVSYIVRNICWKHSKGLRLEKLNAGYRTVVEAA